MYEEVLYQVLKVISDEVLLDAGRYVENILWTSTFMYQSVSYVVSEQNLEQHTCFNASF